MESISFPLSVTSLLTVLAVSLSLFFFVSSLIGFSKKGDHDKRTTVPEASGSWPLLGHLPLLGGPEPPHLVLAKLADRCGPMFTVRLGVHRAIVVNTWELAKECLTTHDRTFATRPKSLNFEVLAYNYAIFSFSPYGPYWRQIRKISTLELLSSHRLELLKHVRESEIHASVNELYNSWRNNGATVSVDMKRWFGDVAINVIFRMIIGKRLSDEDGKKALRDWFELMGRFVISDGLPFLRWLDIGGYERAMKKTAEKLDGVMQQWVDEHKDKRKLQSGEERRHHQDFMDVMLSTLEDDQEVHGYDANTVIKATCITMVLAASDTSAVTLIWALSLLLNHNDSLKKLQQELDETVGKHRQVNEQDYKNLPYLQAVIKETMRLYPAVPLAIPHEATQDCTIQGVNGYFVPKGTRLFLNLHKIQRDPRVWTNPNEFNPERFLTTHKDIDVMGQNFELLPFGSGRRMCPGIAMALPLMGLTLASFLHGFEVRTLAGDDEVVDMSESIGLTNFKATPLQVLIKPRLPEFMYL